MEMLTNSELLQLYFRPRAGDQRSQGGDTFPDIRYPPLAGGFQPLGGPDTPP